jgi:hypothetical protein
MTEMDNERKIQTKKKNQEKEYFHKIMEENNKNKEVQK